MIEKIYNGVINDIIKGIPEEYIDEVKKNYKEYLEKLYSPYFTNDEKSNNQKVAVTIQLEKNKLSSPDVVLSRFVVDESYNRIAEISESVFKKAMEKASGSSIDDNYLADCSKYKEELESNIKKVKPFNAFLAYTMVSEAILDMDYTNGLSKNASIRLSHFNAAKRMN